MRQSYTTDKAPQPSGPYSQAIRVGSCLWIAGQTGRDPLTNRLVASDIIRQSEQAIDNLAAILAGAAASLHDVVRVGVFLADPGELPTFNDVYRARFTEPFPARTAVGVLLPDGMRVELDAIAVVPQS